MRVTVFCRFRIAGEVGPVAAAQQAQALDCRGNP